MVNVKFGLNQTKNEQNCPNMSMNFCTLLIFDKSKQTNSPYCSFSSISSFLFYDFNLLIVYLDLRYKYANFLFLPYDLFPMFCTNPCSRFCTCALFFVLLISAPIDSFSIDLDSKCVNICHIINLQTFTFWSLLLFSIQSFHSSTIC